MSEEGYRARMEAMRESFRAAVAGSEETDLVLSIRFLVIALIQRFGAVRAREILVEGMERGMERALFEGLAAAPPILDDSGKVQ